MAMNLTRAFLYADETGTFLDGDRSAIGGFFSDREVDDQEAWAFWREVYDGPLPEGFVFHGRDLPKASIALIPAAFEALRRRGWRTFVISHISRRTLIDDATTYVCVFAEGITRLLHRMPNSLTSAKILAAARSASVQGESFRRLIEPSEYRQRLSERLAVEEARLSEHGARRRIGHELALGNARSDPRLMIADLICFALGNVANVPVQCRDSIRRDLESHRIEVFRAGVERVEQFVESGYHGLALLELATFAMGDEVPSWIKERMASFNRDLAGLNPVALDRAFEVPLQHVEHLLEHSRDTSECRRLCDLLETSFLNRVGSALAQHERDRLEWVRARLHRTRLAAFNHEGALQEAAAESEKIEALAWRLGDRFEHLPLLIESQVLRAVHLANAYDFVASAELTKSLGDWLSSVLELLADSPLGGARGRLGSELLGKIAGTRLQSLILRGRTDPACYSVARDLSTLALAQFERADDRRRQYGYLAQLETDAGQLEAARAALGMALQGAALTPEALAKACSGEPFMAMHFVRLWEAHARAGDRHHAEEFRVAWGQAALGEDDAWSATLRHPALVVLWKWGSALCATDRPQPALAVLDRTSGLCESLEGRPTLASIALAAQLARIRAIVAVGATSRIESAAAEAFVLLEVLLRSSQPHSLRAHFESWPERLTRAIAERDVASLLRLELAVPY
jgi:hypothetical protein